MIVWRSRDVVPDARTHFRLKNDSVNAAVRVQPVEDARHLPGVEHSEFVGESILESIAKYLGLKTVAKPYPDGLADE